MSKRLLHEKRTWGPTKENPQTKWIFFYIIKLVYCLTRKTLKWNSLVQKLFVSLKRDITLEKQLGVGSSGTQAIHFGDYFYSNNARKLRFHAFLLFHVRKDDIIILPEVDQIHTKLWILFQLWVPEDPN